MKKAKTMLDDLNKKLQQLPTRAEMHNAIKRDIDGMEERLNEKIRLLPTKDEFFTRVDKLSGEIKTVRDEQVVHAGAHSNINDRFDRIDTHLGHLHCCLTFKGLSFPLIPKTKAFAVTSKPRNLPFPRLLGCCPQTPSFPISNFYI